MLGAAYVLNGSQLLPTYRISVHYIYTTAEHTNVYVLNMCPVYTTSAVYNSACLVLCGVILVWFPADSPLRTETGGHIKCGIVM